MMTGAESKIICPSPDISAYIDGELSGARETVLDLHFASCAVCLSELNEQKKFLRSLDLSLRNDAEIDLPENFARRVVANAESTVSGLRRPKERFNAVFVCAALALFGLFVLGAESAAVIKDAAALLDQSMAVGSFFGHLVFSFFIGVAVVMRSFAVRVGPDGVLAAGMFFLFFSLLIFVSRRVWRIRRA